MKNEWTADELLRANEQVLAATETKLAKLKRRHTDAVYEAIEDVVIELACQRNRALAALEELVALVRGECPSLLNEDSGGDAKLSMEIDAAIAACKEGK